MEPTAWGSRLHFKIFNPPWYTAVQRQVSLILKFSTNSTNITLLSWLGNRWLFGVSTNIGKGNYIGKAWREMSRGTWSSVQCAKRINRSCESNRATTTTSSSWSSLGQYVNGFYWRISMVRKSWFHTSSGGSA